VRAVERSAKRSPSRYPNAKFQVKALMYMSYAVTPITTAPGSHESFGSTLVFSL
jgi:hypothetical protein